MRSVHPRRVSLLAAALFVTGFSACTPPSLATGAPAATVPNPALPDSVLVRADIEVLASSEFEGRLTGTRGNDSAAAYLGRRYASLRLAPASTITGPCGTGCPDAYLRPIIVNVAVRGGPPERLHSNNVAGIVRGTDPVLRDEFVVIGAHFDHLGRSTDGAMDPEARDAIRNGADDNASGSAAVLALARRFARTPAKRSILVTHFSGEEQGLLGSARFVQDPPVPLAKMVAMLNFDMVGRLRDDKVIVYGIGTAAEMKALVESAAAGTGLKLSLVPDGTGPSDHSSFYLRDMPVLHFFTDVHPDYHRATDDADKVNIAGEVRVIDLAERALRDIANRPARLTFTKVTTATRTASGPGGGAYFGSIPDMGSAGVEGMLLSGVSAGGPAEKAGIKGGDLIVEFGGKKIKDIYDYTDAIGAYKPNDVVAVVVLRGPSRERHTISVTLGRRGG